MDPVIEKLVTNGSALAVLVVVVWLFLTHLKDTRKEDRATMLNMHEQHLEARKESQLALRENAESTRQNTKAIQSLEMVVNRVGR
jgi:hypothetical protein